MRVDPRLFLSRPNDAPDLEASLLEDAIHDDLRGADRVVIMSAYHSVKYVQQLLTCVGPKKDRQRCQVTLVFGVENERQRVEAQSALRNLQTELEVLKFPQPEVSIYRSEVPFHSKLFHFRRRTSLVWFIGSANASGAIAGDRHEMMIRLRDRNEALFRYIETIRKRATPVRTPPSETAPGDLQSFFLRGRICFQPRASSPFTFDAFRFNAQQRKTLNEALRRGADVPHADPRTEGFGFSLRSAIERLAAAKGERRGPLFGPSRGDSVFLRPYTIETMYGLWIPEAYAKSLNKRIETRGAKDAARLSKLSKQLSEFDDTTIFDEYRSYVRSLKGFFHNSGVFHDVETTHETRFGTFLASRRKILSDGVARDRLARRLFLEPLPDVWTTPELGERFLNSAFDDMALRLSSTAQRQSRIMKVIAKQIKIRGAISPASLRTAFERRLKRSWRDIIWDADTDLPGDDIDG